MFRAIASFFTAAFLLVAAIFISEPPQPVQFELLDTPVAGEHSDQIPFPTQDMASDSAATATKKTSLANGTLTPTSTAASARTSANGEGSQTSQPTINQVAAQTNAQTTTPTATRAPQPTAALLPTAIPQPTATPTTDTTPLEASLGIEASQSVVQANKTLTGCNYFASFSTVSSGSGLLSTKGTGDVSGDRCTLPMGSDGHQYIRVEITSMSSQSKTLEWGVDPDKPRPCSPGDQRLICTQG